MEVKGKTKDTLLQEQVKNSTLIQTNPFPPIFNKIPATSIQVLCNVPLHGRLVTMYGKGIIGDLHGHGNWYGYSYNYDPVTRAIFEKLYHSTTT